MCSLSPWTIIGWLVVGLVALCVAGILFGISRLAMGRLSARVRSRRMLDVAPAAGQRWAQGDSTLTITRIVDNGRICMTTGAASWSDSPGEWRERVKDRNLYLKGQP